MPASDGAGVRSDARDRPARVSPSSTRSFCSTSSARTIPATTSPGFPEHPHRGFETVTYLIAGRVRHEDNKGHKGLLTPGSVQWMTAGRGIVHSEMPEQEHGLAAGLSALGQPAPPQQDDGAALSGVRARRHPRGDARRTACVPA